MKTKSKSNNNNNNTKDRHKKKTLGEELYLVHLSRERVDDSEDGAVTVPPRNPSRSVGEELWEVHIKRSTGLAPEELDKIAYQHQQPTRKAKIATRKVIYHTTRANSKRVMNLRNRDVKIPRS